MKRPPRIPAKNVDMRVKLYWLLVIGELWVIFGSIVGFIVLALVLMGKI